MGWTLDDAPDQTGKVAIVTGANSGIGFEAAKALAGKGAHVVMACRNADKAADAAARIMAAVPGASLEVILLDLADLKYVRAFADAFMARHSRLDLLLNNAAIMFVPYGTTKDGFELQIGTGHLGHFALTGLLLPVLKQTPDARIVTITSTGHRMGKMDFDDFLYARGRYSTTGAYGRAKLSNLHFSYELNRRLEAAGISAQSLSAHPGGADTSLADHLQGGWAYRLIWPLVGFMMQSAEMGAMPGLRALLDPDSQGGTCYGPDGLFQAKGDPVPVKTSRASYREADAQRLWALSEELTGVRFAFS